MILTIPWTIMATTPLQNYQEPSPVEVNGSYRSQENSSRPQEIPICLLCPTGPFSHPCTVKIHPVVTEYTRSQTLFETRPFLSVCTQTPTIHKACSVLSALIAGVWKT